LPDYKGLYPVVRTLMNNEKYLFSTTHFMDKKFDSAKIIAEIKINTVNKNIIKIYEKIHKLNFKLICKSLGLVFSNKANKKTLRKKNKVLYPNPKIIDVLKFKYLR
jgi:methionyl-tRNA formyltransferase|tara:strand:- start:245 stop:562 length:318 start_codon:yes stop_codon:yes gene_type:complete